MKNAAIVLAVVTLLLVIMVVARCNQATLTNGLPPRVVCTSQADALAQAGDAAIPILGTGSMAPYIPASPAGKDPLETIMAYVVIDPAKGYNDIQEGNPTSYHADWYSKYPVMHCAYKKDKWGWIMSGLANPESESRWRVTEKNFIGVVTRVYVWPETI